MYVYAVGVPDDTQNRPESAISVWAPASGTISAPLVSMHMVTV
jgi:hypothetical protein